jgi:hypothetical protein
MVYYSNKLRIKIRVSINYQRRAIMTTSCRSYRCYNRSDATTTMMGGAYNYNVNNGCSIVNRADKLRMTYGCAVDVTVRVTRSVSTWR